MCAKFLFIYLFFIIIFKLPTAWLTWAEPLVGNGRIWIASLFPRFGGRLENQMVQRSHQILVARRTISDLAYYPSVEDL